MKSLKNLYKWAKKYNLHTVFNLVCLYLLQFLYSWLPLLIGYAIKVISNENVSDVNLPSFFITFINLQHDALKIILNVGIIIVSLQFVRSILRFLSNYTQALIAENIAKDMKLSMYDHICDLSYEYHNNVDTGDLIQRCTSDIATSSRFVSLQFPALFDLVITICIGAYQIYRINPTLMMVSSIIIPITGVASILYFNKVNKTFLEVEELESDMMTVIQENVNLARVVRAFSNEKYEFDKMDEASLKFTKATERFNTYRAIFWGFMDSMVGFQYAITILTSVYLVKNNIVDAADIISCLLLLGMLIWPVRGLGRIIGEFGKTLVAVNRLEEVLEIDSEYEINGSLLPAINGNIVFKNVSFKFKDDNDGLLNNISFEINKGETIAIVGRTGCGKTTICNLITRLLEHDSGEILIDGVNIKDIEKKHLRKNIKMVLQDPFLFSKTIYDNIAIANKDIDDTLVYEAASVASISNEITSFRYGYNTIVGEKGTTLSGGQKQRIAIARVLVEKSPVIIFDDSLSALDNKTDLMIRRTLKEKHNDQTMIIITHRTTTIKEADKIIVLEKGEISDIGTHEQLVESNDLYKELWSIQGSLEEDFKKLMEEDYE